MSDPRHYSISILENYSDKSIHEIALIITQSISYIGSDDFILHGTKELELGTEFLYTEYPFTWHSVKEDLAPAFRDFPDTCFCLSVSAGDDGEGGEYRVLFFNNKAVTQYPEVRYEDFRPNDFEYEASGKTPLKVDESMKGKTFEEFCDKAKERGINECIAKAREVIRDYPKNEVTERLTSIIDELRRPYTTLAQKDKEFIRHILISESAQDA